MKSGTRKFKKMVEEERRGARRINRPRWEGGKNRYMKKLLTMKNWYKRRGGKERAQEINTRLGEYRTEREKERETRGGGEDIEPETVMFIPSTPRGELMKLMR